MQRVLYLTICTCLGFALMAYSLKCHYCARKNGGKSCRRKATVCFPKNENKCIKIQVIHRNKLIFSKEGCTGYVQDCERRRRRRYGIVVKIDCCNKDLCNLT